MPTVRNHIKYPNKFSTDIDAFKWVVLNENLSKSDLKVFMLLCCKLESAHVNKIDKDRLADTLSMSRKDLNKCFEHLIEEGIIVKCDDEAVKNGYRFSYIENYEAG